MEILKEFKELIIKHKYYEAHEVLEEYWHTIRKTDNEEKNVYRGFINAAVAMELKKRNRDEIVYKRVWHTYEKYKPLYIKKEEFKEIMIFLDNLKPF